jgi:hypothetical protein
MAYIQRSTGSAYIPKLLGVYEEEIATAVEDLIAFGPSVIADIGAAEGYYAVGLSLRCPHTRVLAFEAEASGRLLLQQMARLNEVSERVAIGGFCTPALLQESLPEAARIGVVCDAEGYERDLLDPIVVPQLRRAFIIVETHEFITRGICAEVKGRFSHTHTITEVHSREREVDAFPYRTWFSACLPKHYLRWAMSEWRPEQMSWLIMKPNDPDQESGRAN